MEAKEAVRALLDRLPDDCSVEDVLYHLYILQAVEHGQADAAAGRTTSHEEVEAALRRKWLNGPQNHPEHYDEIRTAWEKHFGR